MNPLRILLLCHSFNSLTQRLFAELRAAGHTLSVELDIADSVTEEAVVLFQPDLVLAPFLKRRIPATVWQRVTCLVVHPGPPGDQGPSALDWAVWRGEPHWGVTVLQANGDFDAGPVWAHASFDMRPATKGSLYRREVTQAALQATLAAVQGPPLVISGTAGLATPAERDERVAADELLAQRIEAIGVEAFVDEWLALPLFADVPLAVNQRRERLTNTAQGLATSLRRCGQGTQTPLWNDLAQNTTPLLAIAGSLDAKYVAHARRLATTAPHATLRIIPDAGHATHLVAPQLVADEIIHWITNPTAYSTPTTS